uniref:Uncharacterized protein n=1 Tax=Micrurus spixii TaxID=129469 RepID=A0A2D4LGK1_9SAUR
MGKLALTASSRTWRMTTKSLPRADGLKAPFSPSLSAATSSVTTAAIIRATQRDPETAAAAASKFKKNGIFRFGGKLRILWKKLPFCLAATVHLILKTLQKIHIYLEFC